MVGDQERAHGGKSLEEGGEDGLLTGPGIGEDDIDPLRIEIEQLVAQAPPATSQSNSPASSRQLSPPGGTKVPQTNSTSMP
ncbi:MAG: hypothetical protein HC813_00275 [Planctomycetes bacterium]|nr:hypothetical protein [Planctomycetota bacterium]